MPNNNLVLRFDPQTIEHLGIKMYSQLPYALAELVANAYDAAANKVDIQLLDADQSNKQIIIKDDGEGMSYEEVQDKFLVIGRKRRADDDARENSKSRKITGRKGVGKLALFGIGKNIRIETTKLGERQKTVFTLDWDAILGSSGEYSPVTENVDKDNINEQGTTITLSKLTRKSDFDATGTAISLSKLFNCFDDEFIVSISQNDDSPITLTRELRYEGINQQFEWRMEDLTNLVEDNYARKNELKGLILSSEKPMKQDLRGIALYANGRLVNTPGFFGASEAGHTFTYMSGWIEADFLDETDDDLISTDRQSLSWDLPEAEALQAYLQKVMKYLVKDWSQKRKEINKRKASERSGVNVQNWADTMPDNMKRSVEKVVEKVGDNPALDDEDYSSVIQELYRILPNYPIYHWRNLHLDIQSASKTKYENGDYYGALEEACKVYCQAVRDKVNVKDPTSVATLPEEDTQLMNKVFCEDPAKAILSIALNATRPDGTPFTELTKRSLEAAQRNLSAGIVTGYRNPLAHELHDDLSVTGAISEQHCLDALSLLSLLYLRLDGAEKTP